MEVGIELSNGFDFKYTTYSNGIKYQFQLRKFNDNYEVSGAKYDENGNLDCILVNEQGIKDKRDAIIIFKDELDKHGLTDKREYLDELLFYLGLGKIEEERLDFLLKKIAESNDSGL